MIERSPHVSLVKLKRLVGESHAGTEPKRIPVGLLVQQLRHRGILRTRSHLVSGSGGGRRKEHWLLFPVEAAWVWARATGRLNLGVFDHIGFVFLLYAATSQFKQDTASTRLQRGLSILPSCSMWFWNDGVG